MLTFVDADVLWVVEGKEAELRDERTAQYIKHAENSQVFHHLSKEETLRVINEARVHLRHIVDTRKSLVHLRELIQRVRRGARTLDVLDVASDSERVEVALEHLGTEDVVGAAVEDVEAVLSVERKVACVRRVTTREVSVGGDPCESFGADAGAIQKNTFNIVD